MWVWRKKRSSPEHATRLMQMHLPVHVIIITITIITVIIERGGEARLPTRDGQGRFFHRAGRGKANARRGRAE